MTAIDIPTNFRTTLAPRKRAKTQEEKEQRRIERILRNRKAAHASREKKRKHVEFLEKYVLDLEKQLHMYSSLNTKLQKHYQGGDGDIDRLVNKIATLPDLQQVKMNHNIELEESKDEVVLPRTPESFTSSPNHSQDELKLEPNTSSSDLMSKISPISSPRTTDKFSLNLIGGPLSFGNNNVKQEEADQLCITEFLHNTQPSIIEEELQFPEQLDETSFFFQSEFDELRNPAAITPFSGLISMFSG